MIVLVANANQTSAGQPDAAERLARQQFFENEVRPLLIQRCYECHSEDANEGGLRLDQSNSLTKGGDSGRVVEPKDVDASLLMAAVRYDGLEMPPDEPLSDKDVATLARWVETGAYWPETWAGESDTNVTTDEVVDWWASKPIDPARPVVSDVRQDVPAAGPIDDYIDAELAHNDLTRAPQADRALLARRLYYDLLGVPPTPEQVAAFVNDASPNAYSRLVDSVFANPMHGERLARLWLDLVRYAESDGYRADAFRPSAHKYRDWVINAFNDAMPYDQFVALQLAGDEIAPDDPDALAATGFLRLGIYEYNQRDAEGQWQFIVDEMTDVTADVFLATGLACAKCHDHKFDPIPRSDYFNLRSVFEPLTFADPRPPAKRSPEIVKLRQELDAIEGDAIDELEKVAVERFPENVQAMYNKPASQRTSYEEQISNLVYQQVLWEWDMVKEVKKRIGEEKEERRQEILTRLDELGANPRPDRDLMAVADAPGPTRPTRIPGRNAGREFLPAIPQLFGGFELPVSSPSSNPESTGRRTALAEWIVSRDNPITPRVIVNRLWQYHMGTGLVSTPNDFGELGRPPSHPDLLDYLADRLLNSGWDLKRIQRDIVMSETYRQSSVHPDVDRGMLVDAKNELHWHRSARRLDAEQFRDSLLCMMDHMEPQIGGPSHGGSEPRRTIYAQRKRNTSDEMLQLMDAPTGIVGAAKRDVTITPTQALMLLNNDRLLSVSKKFAQRIRRDMELDANASLDADAARQFVSRAVLLLTSVPAEESVCDSLVPLITGGSDGTVDACHVLLNTNAFQFLE